MELPSEPKKASKKVDSDSEDEISEKSTKSKPTNIEAKNLKDLKSSAAPLERLFGIVARTNRNVVEIKVGTMEAQEALEDEDDPQNKADDKLTQIIEITGIPELPIDIGDVLEANVKAEPSKNGLRRYIVRGFPLITIPSTAKAIIQVFQKFLRSQDKSRALYRQLIELHETPQKVVKMISDKASRWYLNRNSFPGTSIRQTNTLLKFWYQERNLRQLLLYGFNRKEIFTYLKYAERTSYQMVGDVLNNPTALFNITAFKLKAITKITGRVFWENIHQFLNQVFVEMFGGRMFLPLRDLTAAEEMLLTEMPVQLEGASVYLNYAHSIYTDLRKALTRLVNSEEAFRATVGRFEIPARFQNDSDQQEAFTRAISRPFTTIVGSAGTGKSELILYIFNTLVLMNRKVAIGAYTGKASAKLGEGRQRNILSMEAQRQFDPRTLHSISKSKATIETLIIDEVSMLNAELLANIFREHSEITQLILVGDMAQLPPMGIGHLLASLDKRSYSIELTKTHRFDGDLLDVATAVRNGRMPVESDNFKKMEGDDGTVTALTENILDLPGCGINDIAIISYYNKTVDVINKAIQKILLKRGITQKGIRDQRKQRWNIGDRVIFLENNPDIRVWNGQEGLIHKLSEEDETVVIAVFGGIEVKLATQWSDKDQNEDKEDEQLEKFEHTPVDELTTRQIRLSYALTGYKAQGSQWKIVIVYLEKFGKSNKRINRNYLYTAITRAQESLFFIGNDFFLKRGLSQVATFYPFPLEIGGKYIEKEEDSD